MSSPLEQFNIIPLLSMESVFLSSLLTNLGLTALIASSIIIVLLSMQSNRVLPSNWSIINESLFSSLKNMTKNQIGNEYYFPVIITLFTTILIINLVGNVPYTISIMSNVAISMTLSIIIFLGVTLLGWTTHKLKWFSILVPQGTPVALIPLLVLIETISYCARAVSLGVRIFANMVAGKVLAAILSKGLFSFFKSNILIKTIAIIPFFIFTAILGLELAVAFIQAYVFTILTSSYIKDALNLHD